MFCSVGSVLDSRKCFGFREVFLDSGKCFVPMNHRTVCLRLAFSCCKGTALFDLSLYHRGEEENS